MLGFPYIINKNIEIIHYTNLRFDMKKCMDNKLQGNTSSSAQQKATWIQEKNGKNCVPYNFND